jgi:AraC-like DNA-binding protein
MNVNPQAATAKATSNMYHLPSASDPSHPMSMAPARFHELADLHPTLILLGSDLIYVGRPYDLSPHRVTVTTIAIALERPFELDFASRQTCEVQELAVIPARTLHHLRATGTMAFVYTGAHGMRARLPEDFLDVAQTLASRIGRSDQSSADALALATELIALFKVAPPEISPGIAIALAATDRSPYDIESAARAADVAGLATQAFRRRVRRETGMTFGQHRQRARVHAAIRALARGETLTEAAHDVGFASSAHFSATVRTMFGLAPSTLKRNGVRIIADDGIQQSDS